MNTDALQRVTFVLDRATADRLAVIASRLGVSRSSLAREVLEEPIQLMHRWVTALPSEPTKAEADAMLRQVADDVEAFMDSKASQLDLLKAEGGGNA